MGLRIRVPFAGDFNPALPYASSIDAAITPGSLMLIEPSHSYLPWGVGVPGEGATLKNVAWTKAKAMLGGAGDVATLAPSFTYPTPDLTKLTFERTGKGAFHAISSAGARNSKSAIILMPAPIRDYLATNSGHAYALFVWARVTRAAANGQFLYETTFANNGSASSNFLLRDDLPNAAGLVRRSNSMPTGWTGAPNANAGLNGGGPYFGNAIPFNGQNGAGGRSYALYRWHLIDLAAAGMTFAQADALDAAAYASAFGTGGRYASDAWTDPATVIST